MQVNGLIQNNHLMLNFRPEKSSVSVDYYKNWITGFFMCIFGKAIKLRVTINNSKKTLYVNKENLKIKSIESLIANQNNYASVLKRIDHAAFKILLNSSYEKGSKYRIFKSIFSSIDFAIFKNEMQKRIQIEEEIISKSHSKNELVTSKAECIEANSESKANTPDAAKGRLDQLKAEINKLKAEAETSKTQAKADIAKLEAKLKTAQLQIDKLEAEADKIQKKNEELTKIKKIKIPAVFESLNSIATNAAKQTKAANDREEAVVSEQAPKKKTNIDIIKGESFQSKVENGVKIITRTTVLKLAKFYLSLDLKSKAEKNKSISLSVSTPIKLVNKTPEITSDVNVKALGMMNQKAIMGGLLANLRKKEEEMVKNGNLLESNKNNSDSIQEDPSPIKVIDDETGEQVSQETLKDIAEFLINEERENSDPETQYQLAVMIEEGMGGLQVNLRKMFALLESSAKQGNVDAKCKLAQLYSEGNRVTQDKKKALELFEEAAILGNVIAQYNSALYYEKGIGVDVDKQKALHWYQMAAAQGDEDAVESIRILRGDAREDEEELKPKNLTPTYFTC